MGYGADIQHVRWAGGDQLAHFTLRWIWPPVPELGVTATGAGEPPKEGGARQKDYPNVFSPRWLRRVEIVAERAPILIQATPT